MTNKIKFSSAQYQIVKNVNGAMSVIASAGSGKTRVLTGRIEFLLESVPGSYKVLALTFTNKAADEMKDRLSSLPNIGDRAFIGTIHSFCLNLLREKGNIIGLNEMPHIFEKESDRLEVVTEVFKRNESLTHYYIEKDDRNKRILLYNALDYISDRKRNLKLTNENDEIELSLLYDDYNRFLSEQNAIDYDDIILLAYRILSERLKVAELYRNIYKYICVDEAQDLNFAQYQFIKTFCGDSHKNILMVGDDKQAIFGFNGSDKKYFSEMFINDFNAVKFELTENYRSSKSVIRIANLIYPNSIDITHAVYEGKLEYFVGDNERLESKYVIDTIKNYLINISDSEKNQIEGDISLEKICVIARNKFIFKTLELELESAQFPYFYKKGSNTTLFESDEMKIFELGVRIILNPFDKLHLREIHSILKDKDITNYDFKNTKAKLKAYNSIYKSIVESWEKIEVDSKNFRDAIDVIQSGLMSISDIDDPNHLELLFDEINLAKDYWKKYCTSVSIDLISIQHFFSNIALGMINVKNKKEIGLTLGTVHSLKGLEYDIVFVIGLNEGSFPDYRAVKADGKQLEEEKNLTYVALTRAKRFLHITYPKTKIMPWDMDNPYTQYPSRFLKKVFEGIEC